ncbi:MAG TPA: heme-binding domain-containing protein [Actinomycetota bacterium]|nr:heme-binding domain-containing protein [Actinomycetota bacterium]
MAIRRALRLGLLSVIGVFLLIQVIPYGRDHTNPPVDAEPAWDSPATRELASAACFDCHSNETRWPWYTSVAPVSWFTQHDVEEGRETLNFSEWNRPQETDEVAEAIREGSMPPWTYRVLHPAARLSDAEIRRLIAGLEATFRASPPG